jgi:hypothetical protein
VRLEALLIMQIFWKNNYYQTGTPQTYLSNLKRLKY